MTSADQKQPVSTLSDEELDEMAKHGVTRTSVDVFHCGGYRYTNLKDAIAQAKRQKGQAAG